MVWSADGQGRYRDRRHAGRELAGRVAHLKGNDVVVLALPRGGVPVAFEVARALEAPLDVFVVRKLGLPGHPEYAMGAIASGGLRVLNDEVVRLYRVPEPVIDALTAHEPARVIVAVPVGSPDTCRECAHVADEVVCGRAPEHFSAVGQWYNDFRQTTDEEVRELLHATSSEPAGKPQ